MSLNIKPWMTKDHPDVTHPVKPMDEGREVSGEDAQDITKRSLNQDSQQNSLGKKLRDEIKKKIDPKGILRRLDIIK